MFWDKTIFNLSHSAHGSMDISSAFYYYDISNIRPEQRFEIRVQISAKVCHLDFTSKIQGMELNPSDYTSYLIIRTNGPEIQEVIVSYEGKEYVFYDKQKKIYKLIK